MGIDLNALKSVQKELDDKLSRKDDTILYASSIKKDIIIRILPPLPIMNGIYYLEVINYWFEKVRGFVSPATFGIDCPIEEELADARNSPDDSVRERAAKVRRTSEFRMPILQLNDEPLAPMSDNPKIFVCGTSLMRAINRIAVHRNYLPDITDRERGFNITINRTGEGINTVYTPVADRDPTIMPEGFYELKNIPNVRDSAERYYKHPDYLRAYAREFLYGEPIPPGLEKKRGIIPNGRVGTKVTDSNGEIDGMVDNTIVMPKIETQKLDISSNVANKYSKVESNVGVPPKKITNRLHDEMDDLDIDA